MANKRGNGEGSITKLKNGTYMGKIMIGFNSDGKPNRKSVYGKTRKEVSEKLIALANSVNMGTYIEPSKMTLSTWLDTWLKQYKSLDLKPKTYDTYEQAIKTNIKPIIGDILLKDLKAIDIQKMINVLSIERKLSPGTVKRTYAVLKGCLKQAVINELIYKNFADTVTLPKQNSKQIKVFSLAEQALFLESAKEYRLYPAFVVNIDTGLRRGELLALTWDDVDFDNNIINVNKNIVSVKNKKSKKYEIVVQDTTKTASGMRKVPLTQRAALVLKELKLKQQKFSEIVFCSEKGSYVDPRNYNRTFMKVLKKAELSGFSPHVLRHTYATRLFEQGIQPKTVSELLGHSNITITLNIYTHVMPETKTEAVKVLDRLYSEG